jgi:hypothetical protein
MLLGNEYESALVTVSSDMHFAICVRANALN